MGLPPAQPPPIAQVAVRPIQRVVDSTAPPEEIQAWFALPDSTGTLLICMGRDKVGSGPFFLATLGGRPVPLVDLGVRTESEHWSHREISPNFWDVGGQLFRIAGDTVVPDQTYLVVSRTFLEAHHPLRLTADKCRPMDSVEASGLTWTAARRVRKAWSLGWMDSTRIAAVQFEGTPPMAALVVARRDSLLTARYPGGTSDSESVWRVDDGGEFDGCSLGLIAAFRSAHGIELAQSWAGEEGESDVLLQRSADTFASIVVGYRYWSP